MKIKHKILMTFGVLVVFIFTIVGVNLQSYNTLENDAIFVNYAGRIRATTFRMGLLANLYSQDNQDESLKKELQETLEIFDTLLNGIRYGDEELGLTPLQHGPSIERIAEIEETWDHTFREEFNEILHTGNLESPVNFSEGLRKFTTRVNEMVTNYSDYSHGKVVNAKIINGLLAVLALVIGFISFYFLNKGIKRPIGSLTRDLKALSQGSGDLTNRIEITTKDEIAEMTAYFNDFIKNIHEIVTGIAGVSSALSDDMNAISLTTEELTKSTEMIAGSAMDVAQGSADQNTQLEELNALAEQLKNDIINVSQKASQTLSASDASQLSVEKGNAQVESQSKDLNEFAVSIKEASATVEDLNKSSEQIKAIVEIIQSISSQTNLLALNASIEAARAGEAGKGFAVVADEIRSLAEETAISASQISDIVTSINDNTFHVKVSMDGLVDKTKSQESSMEVLKNELYEILNRSTMTLEESRGIMEIANKVDNDFNRITQSVDAIQGLASRNSDNTQDVASAVEEQTAAFEEVSANISSMDEMANKLNEIVGTFKI